jgi:biopolymer transport protein ExbB
MKQLIPLPKELYSLFESGGPVLWAIILLTFILWALVIERVIFLWHTFPKNRKISTHEKENIPLEKSWLHSAKINAELSEGTIRIFSNLSLIGALISLFPLLGLLGTVIGMIRLFDVLAYIGNTNAKAISSGVSMAVVPTVAGMFLAIIGIAARVVLLQRAKYHFHQLELHLK